MIISQFSASDVGLKRKINEDYRLVDERLGLYLLADGLGGHPFGEVASKLACIAVQDYFSKNRYITVEKLNVLYKFPDGLSEQEKKFFYSVVTANRAIIEMAKRDQKYQGMGSTLVGIHALENELCIADVGDSRIYRLREGAFDQLTEDHTVLNEQLKKGKYSPKELAEVPMMNQLARALGHMAKSRVDVKTLKPEKGDLYLLCSDGLTNMVDDTEIAKTLMEYHQDLEKSAGILVEKAKESGGVDNITLVLVRVDDV